MKYKEHKNANLKESAGELVSHGDSSNAELSAVMQYPAKLNARSSSLPYPLNLRKVSE